MPAPKTGLVVITKAIEHMCRLIAKYNSKIIAAINAAVIGGFISSGDGAIAIAWIEALTGVCVIFKRITGY